MGTYMMSRDEIELNVEVNERLIEDYIIFSELTCPEDYRREKFPNTWFFNRERKLVSLAGKFAEASIWYDHLRDYFFEPRGIHLPEKVAILADMDRSDFWEINHKRQEEFFDWYEMKSNIEADRRLIHIVTYGRKKSC